MSVVRKNCSLNKKKKLKGKLIAINIGASLPKANDKSLLGGIEGN